MEWMNDHLARIYDHSFCAEYGTTSPLYTRCCALIAEEIARRFQPSSAVDWGCGAGLHVAALTKLGVHTLGVDGVEWPEEFRAPGIEFRQVDLSARCPEGIAPMRYDLSLCLDVMEHLPESDSQMALENITRGAGLLLLSCAPPGQGGHHHVNEQPRRYWIQRLADMGWVYDRRTTGQMERSFFARRDELPLSWMYHNLCVYRPSGKHRGI